MNFGTITTKTGLTAIASIIGTALGIYTGVIPMAVGLQTIITSLLALFIRDSITTQTSDLAALQQEAAQIAKNESAAATVERVKAQDYQGQQDQRATTRGGA